MNPGVCLTCLGQTRGAEGGRVPVPRAGVNKEPRQPCCGHSGFIPAEKTNETQSVALACAAIVLTLDMCVWLSKASDIQAPWTQERQHAGGRPWRRRADGLFVVVTCRRVNTGTTCRVDRLRTRTRTRRRQAPPKSEAHKLLSQSGRQTNQLAN